MTMEIIYFDMETIGKHEEPWRGKIITIQIRTRGETTIWKEWELGEKGVIDAFFNYLNSIVRKEHVFIGWACTRKDVPYLNIRMREVKAFTRKRFQILNFWLSWVDFYHLLGAEWVKFRDMSEKFKLKHWEGKHASLLYREKKFDEVVKYIESEMKAMEQLHQAFRKSPLYEELKELRGQVSYDFEQRI